MTPAPFTSALTAPLLGDTEAAALLSDAAFIGQMIRVESAFARACGAVGVIPAEMAQEIGAHLDGLMLDPQDLGAGMASAGVPVPALVAQLRAAMGREGEGLHWGATSQDIVDCAHVLQWRDLLTLLEGRLGQLLEALHTGSDAQAQTLMAGRTRSQSATPITLGLRMATWAQPLIALEAELPHLRAQVLRVQYGGASGAASATGAQSEALSNALAQALGLAPAPCWHLDRSGPQALGAWLVRLSAALAKLARDLIISGRSEIDELRAGAGGGSSTMPQKSNPVAAEAIVALAQYSASLHPLLAQAAMPLEERDGAAWALEWLALPQMGMAAAACLRHAAQLIGSLQPAPDRMRAQLDAGNGAIMAEAASFALARHMPRTKASAVVKDTLELARKEGLTLAQALARNPALSALEDWEESLSPRQAAAPAEAMRLRIWAMRRST
ncbi:MAG: adenylosuccinate lyase family protein [Roseinatronobacter sp.]|nr:adenylosuccinate lyase family protein [Roseinatronobacter sp.]